MFKKGQRVRHLKEGSEGKIIQIDKLPNPPYGLKYKIRLDVGGVVWAREDWLESWATVVEGNCKFTI